MQRQSSYATIRAGKDRPGGPYDSQRQAKAKGSARDSSLASGTGVVAHPRISSANVGAHESKASEDLGLRKGFRSVSRGTEKNKNYCNQDLVWCLAGRYPVGGLDE